MSLGIAGSPVQAHEAAGPSASLAQAEPTYGFAIEPAPLAAALDAFSAVTGWQVGYPAEVTQGAASPGVRGTFTAEAALRQLLAGTPVTYRLTAANAVALSRIAAVPGATTLAPVTVEAAGRFDPATTEGSGSYAATHSTVGSKTATRTRDVAQSVSVVPRQRIEDQNMRTMGDALDYTVGVTVAPGWAEYDGVLTSRGYGVSTLQIDGVVGSYNFAEQARDLAIYDRVEVLRGPAGLFTGAGEPSATINLVRKRPTNDFHIYGNAFAGSWNYRRLEGDVTGPLIESKKLRGRLVAVYEDRDWWAEGAHQQREILYGTVAGDVTEDTTVTLGASMRQTDATPVTTLPAYTDGRLLSVSRTTNLRNDWEYTNYGGGDGFLEVMHHFNTSWRLRSNVRVFNEEREWRYTVGTTGVNPNTNVETRRLQQTGRTDWRVAVDNNLAGSFDLFDRTHDIVLGWDYEREWAENPQYVNGATYAQNVYGPVVAQPEPNLRLNQVSEAGETQSGAYGQMRFRARDWLALIGGGRLTNWETENQVVWPTEGAHTERGVANEFTPFGGTVVDVTDEVSLYGSYADIFQPQGSRRVDGSFLPPRIGWQVEVGSKAEFYEGAMTASVAAYRIEDVNRARDDPANPTFSIPSGEVVTRGVELELNGRPAEGWEIYAGYSHNISLYRSDDTNPGGNANEQHPRHTFTFWGTRKFGEGDGVLDGFSFGGGARYVTKFGIARNNIPVHENGYLKLDARVGYQISENLEASVTIENVLDETYYRYVNGHVQGNLYGAPRNAMFVLRAKY
ncbi:MAG: TonB-dependent siderophore receptor [Alphaproteobacteria bacterium]